MTTYPYTQGGFIIEETTIGSGTGNYESFLRIQANDTDEEGYNTDVNSQLDDKNGPWTHSLLVSNLVAINIGGIDYYEIRLDLNEAKSGDERFMDLDELQIYVGGAAGATPTQFTGLTKIFDLAGSIELEDANHGSGTDDYRILIPKSEVDGKGAYLTLYANFSNINDGFEEFRALSSEFVPTPDIGILKETNLTDDACPYIIVGDAVTWRYTVENNGNVPLENVVVTDDGGTPDLLPGDELDDFNPTYVSGDTHNIGVLDTDETWIFEFTLPGGAVAGEYFNTATVSGVYDDGSLTGQLVTSSETDCYFGAAPDISIVKLTNGTDNLCPVLHEGDTVTWTYNVKNEGNVALDNIQIYDDGGTPDLLPGDELDDIIPTQVLDLITGFNVGDTNGDGIFDPGETWQYTATGTAAIGNYENTAYVTGDFTDDFDHKVTVDAHESDCYQGVAGPGVRTPGFWANWQDFWDGDVSVPKQAGTDCFPLADLLYQVDKNGDGTLDSTPGLLIGDYDKNGVRNGSEDVFFISLADAQSIINAKNNQMSDGVLKIARDVIATWLNYLEGNPIGTIDAGDGKYSPKEAIEDAVDYLQIFGDKDNSNATGFIDTGDLSDCYSSNHKKVDTSSAYWNSNFPGGGHSGAQIHAALDEYNNFGTVNGTGYAASCDNESFVVNLNGFMTDQGLVLM